MRVLGMEQVGGPLLECLNHRAFRAGQYAAIDRFAQELDFFITECSTGSGLIVGELD